jgi:hypothetical protein
MYRGFSISLVCIPVFNTIYFPIYGEIKDVMRRSGMKDGETKFYAVSAGLAGTICNVITNPLWLVRTRMQTEIFQNTSAEHFDRKWGHGAFSLGNNIMQIVENEGFFALWKGISASFLGLLHPVVFFPLYEKSKLTMR